MSDLIDQIVSPAKGVNATREGRGEGPYLCGDWERRKAKCWIVIYEDGLLIRSVYTATASLPSFGPSEAHADCSSEEGGIKEVMIRGVDNYRG